MAERTYLENLTKANSRGISITPEAVRWLISPNCYDNDYHYAVEEIAEQANPITRSRREIRKVEKQIARQVKRAVTPQLLEQLSAVRQLWAVLKQVHEDFTA